MLNRIESERRAVESVEGNVAQDVRLNQIQALAS